MTRALLLSSCLAFPWLLASCTGIDPDPEAYERYAGFSGNPADEERFEQILAAYESGTAIAEVVQGWEHELVEMAARHPTNLRVLSLLQDLRSEPLFVERREPLPTPSEAAASFLEARRVLREAQRAFDDAQENRGEHRRLAPELLQEELQRAESILEEALDADDGMSMGWVLRARIRLLRRPKDLEGALTFLERALALRPQDLGVRRYLARVHELANNPYGAMEQYQQILTADPNDTEARFNYALALRQAGRLRSAMVSLEEVLATRPGFLEAAHTYGALLIETGRPRRALEHYEAMARDFPGDPRIDYSLGVLHHVHLDQPEEALLHYRRFLERETEVGRTTLAVENYVRQIELRLERGRADS